MLPGVRPIMRLASAPTATIWPLLVLSATTDGSFSTIPRPRTYTSVFAVPRSTAMSRPRNVSALLIGNGPFRSGLRLFTCRHGPPRGTALVALHGQRRRRLSGFREAVGISSVPACRAPGAQLTRVPLRDRPPARRGGRGPGQRDGADVPGGPAGWSAPGRGVS